MRRSRKRHTGRLIIPALLLLAAGVVVLSGMRGQKKSPSSVLAEAIPYEAAGSDERTGESRITYGISVGGVDVSGLTRNEASAKLAAAIQEKMNAPVTLSGPEQGEQVQLTAGELGFSIDMAESLDLAMSFGHAQNIIQRYKEQKDLEREGRNYEFAVSVDEGKLRTALDQKARGFDQPAAEPKLRRESGAFIVEEGRNGYVLDLEKTVQDVAAALQGEQGGQPMTLAMSYVVDAPKGRADDLYTIKDLLGTYTTSYPNSGAARCGNIDNGCSHLNGKLLYPGEELSVLQNITPFTEANGYHLAGSYVGNKVVDSLGGGICQVSTTLYNAVIRAELKVTARYNHSLIVSYVQPSMDAAIAESAGMDFKFVNSSDYPIYIEGYTYNKSITFNIYGTETRSSGRKISFESETLETIPPEGLEVIEDPTQPIGYVSVEGGHTGYKAQLWKIVTENGAEVSRDVFNRSTYNMTPDAVTVGTGGTVTSGLRQAMESKDLAMIRSAAQVAASMQSAGPLADQAAQAAQAAFEAALADGKDTESAMSEAQAAANAVVAAANEENSGNSSGNSGDSSSGSGNNDSSSSSGSSSQESSSGSESSGDSSGSSSQESSAGSSSESSSGGNGGTGQESTAGSENGEGSGESGGADSGGNGTDNTGE